MIKGTLKWALSEVSRLEKELSNAANAADQKKFKDALSLIRDDERWVEGGHRWYWASARYAASKALGHPVDVSNLCEDLSARLKSERYTGDRLKSDISGVDESDDKDIDMGMPVYAASNARYRATHEPVYGIDRLTRRLAIDDLCKLHEMAGCDRTLHLLEESYQTGEPDYVRLKAGLALGKPTLSLRIKELCKDALLAGAIITILSGVYSCSDWAIREGEKAKKTIEYESISH